jgi:transposase
MRGRANVPSFRSHLCRLRNRVERFFNKLKLFRAVATRFEKHDAKDLAVVNSPPPDSGRGLGIDDLKPVAST